MRCKTGCGKEAVLGDYFCTACRFEWESSAERVRFHDVDSDDREGVAVMDFCNRVRAERRPEVPR